MKITIHRGSKEIGGSCVEVEASGKRLIIDLGLPLDAKNDRKYLPPIEGLDGSDDSLLAIVISHVHMDHFGLLAHISDKIPVIMGEDAHRILMGAAPFMPGNWPTPRIGRHLKAKQPIEIGPFHITPYLVDHSAYDAYALLIEAGGKRLFYSGDLRMHGRKARLTEELIANPPEHIDALLLEGSSLGRLDENSGFPSEADLEKDFVDIFRKTKGLALVHTSAQNIDRVVSIFRACKKTGRKLLIDLYTAVILEATGNEKLPKSHWPEVALVVPQPQCRQVKEKQWHPLLEKHSTNRILPEDLKSIAGKSVLLFRPLYMRDLANADCLGGAKYIYSQWEGYWQEESTASLRVWLERHAIPKISIHTSGHASPADLKRFALAMRATKVVPMHTFHPEQYAELYDNVEFHSDGECWEV